MLYSLNQFRNTQIIMSSEQERAICTSMGSLLLRSILEKGTFKLKIENKVTTPRKTHVD